MNTRLNRLRAERASIQSQLKRSSKSLRKARTRTLIQLGGLIHKCGLTEKFGIELGEDLQVDEAAREKAEELIKYLEKTYII